MNKYQGLIVVVIILAVLGVIAAIAYFMGSGPMAAQRFRANPGAERENAAPIVSERTDRDEEQSGRGMYGTADTGMESQQGRDAIFRGDPQEIAQRIAQSIPEEPLEVDLAPIEELDAGERDNAEEIVMGAMSAVSPEQGLEFLAEMTATLNASQASASIYTAAATLYMRTNPPRPDEALGALKRGARIADSPEDRADIAMGYADFLRKSGKTGDAIDYLEDALNTTADFTTANVEAWLLTGAMYEEQEDLEGAATAYTSAMEDAMAFVHGENGKGASLYREASMRLARIHRERGDEAKAKEVVENAKAVLNP